MAAAVNSAEVLAQCLARSPDIASGAVALRTYEGSPNASTAYNRALADGDAAVVVLAHQDVYLPRRFFPELAKQLAILDRMDPDWAVAGAVGKTAEGDVVGQAWSTGIGVLTGQPIDGPRPVVTLDELIIIVRRGAGLAFDETLPGFHLYASDIVQIARARGLGAYALPLPVIHHSRPLVRLDAGYHRAYRHMQAKWSHLLPIPNLVCPIEKSPLTLFKRDAWLRWRSRGRLKRADAGRGDPVEIARGLGYEA